MSSSDPSAAGTFVAAGPVPSFAEAFAFEPLEAPAPVAPVDVLQAAAPDPVALALEEAATIRDAAREEGRAEGLAAGRIEALEACRPAVGVLVEAASALSRQREEAAERLEREAAQLALALAEKLVVAALEVDPERVVDVVRGALRGVPADPGVIVHVHPEDVLVVRDALGLVAGGATADPATLPVVVEDRRQPRGGARVQTPDGEIDATLATKLDRARDVVRAALDG